MKINNILVVYYVHNYETLEYVESVLRHYKLNYRCISRDKCSNDIVKKRDLIIVVGGDGTFLRVTHHVYDATPILNVTSEYHLNEGFFSRATKEDFREKLGMVLKGKYRIKKLPRLETAINGKKLPVLAINELFVGSGHPYHTSRYIIKLRGKSEFQKSSGILITTQAGSSGWAKSAAKKKFAIPENGFGYVVREPYFGRLTKPIMLQGTLKPNETIRIESITHHGVAVIDSSDREHKFVDGYRLEVTMSKKLVSLIEF